MPDSNFDHLLYRYVTGQVSERERKKIEAWLDVMKAERDTELNMSEADLERVFEKITNTTSQVGDVIALYPRKPLLVRLASRPWMQVAASVVILLAMSFTLWTIATGMWTSAPMEKLALNDGTLVWLKEGSTLTYYQTEEGTRHAVLHGEGLFEVAKIPHSTFTVACNDVNVTVMGTSFNLKAKPNGIELKVLTGRVNLSSKQDTSIVTVNAREHVVYTVNGKVEREALQEDQVESVVANTEYNMRFENTEMQDVIKRIEKKFDVDIIVTNAQLNICRVTADFTDTALDSSLVMITNLLDVSFERNDKEIRLHGAGCR